MKKLLVSISILFFALQANAQTCSNPIAIADINELSLINIDRQKHDLHATLASGKTIIIYFFDATKSNCHFASKIVERMYQKHQNNNTLEVWALDLNADTKNRHLKQYRADNELNYTIFGSSLNKQAIAQVYEQYGNQTPEFLIVHPDKSFVAGVTGLNDLKVVSKRLVQQENFLLVGENTF